MLSSNVINDDYSINRKYLMQNRFLPPRMYYTRRQFLSVRMYCISTRRRSIALHSFYLDMCLLGIFFYLRVDVIDSHPHGYLDKATKMQPNLLIDREKIIGYTDIYRHTPKRNRTDRTEPGQEKIYTNTNGKAMRQHDPTTFSKGRFTTCARH